MSEEAFRKMVSRTVFGRGESNPKDEELAAQAHFTLERGTCYIKPGAMKKEGK